MPLLEPGGELKKIFQTAAGDSDILIELAQAGVPQGVRKLTPKLPKGFALIGTQSAPNEFGTLPAQVDFQSLDLSFHTSFLTVQLHHHMALGAFQKFAAGPLAGRSQGKGVGDFQSTGEKAGAENGADGSRGRID